MNWVVSWNGPTCLLGLLLLAGTSISWNPGSWEEEKSSCQPSPGRNLPSGADRPAAGLEKGTWASEGREDFCALADPGAGSDQVQADPQAVREVETGQRPVANAAWWGFDPQDATRALQSAICSPAKKIIVPKMPTAWIVDKIELVGNKEILFEPGVEVIAKRGSFRGKTDSLFTAWNQSHLKLIGPGAKLRMWRNDYDQPPYQKAEWRHVLSLRGCSEVVVEGLTLAESGGDGIYLGAGRRGEPNRNITIRNVLCLNNYRQGISVITAENLLLENVVIRGTRGTPPQAGIDFEPNHPREMLINCILRNCRFEDNTNFAILVSLGALNSTSPPVSIYMENCTTKGTNAGSLLIYNRNQPEMAVRGTVQLKGCRFEDTGQAQIVLYNPVGGLEIEFSGCRMADPAKPPHPPTPILFRSRPSDEQDIGQVRFEDFRIVDPIGRVPIGFENPAGVCLRKVQGHILVQKGQEVIRYDVGPAWLARHFPCDPIRQLPIVSLSRPRVVKSGTTTGAMRAVAGHRLRTTAQYLLVARQGEWVRTEMAYQQVGRYEGKPLPLEIVGPGGRVVRTLQLPFRKTTRFEFQAPVSGIYQLRAQPGSNTVRLVQCTHPVAIAGPGGMIHLLGTTGQFYFYLPAYKPLGIAVAAQGPKEQFSLELTDQEGQLLWQQLNCPSPRSIFLEPGPKDRLVQLRLLRPEQASLEDIYIRFRGAGAILSLEPDLLLWAEATSSNH